MLFYNTQLTTSLTCSLTSGPKAASRLLLIPILHTEEMVRNRMTCSARLYPRYGSSVTHLTQSATKTKDDDQHRLGSTTKTNNRLSWPQFSPNQIPAVNKQRSMDNDKPVFRRVINPEEAKVLERATQIVMYVLW